ncbi:glycosyltransferase family 4 protein [Microbacterium esteraromaticum]|uniref:glycosyltransferase family 4 protein n=1 Tax=Microbacterium esteraromaticum TaxID=57043 RepID=UPI001C9488D6|nr:glycosyltransferase family 4 protein [Microbacterium esteraromaticum]MBY6060659.1 glycosyltransferase family 4 protein [Microbacterium esteraromaticum]
MTAPVRVVIASRLFPPEVSAGAFRLGALARVLAEQGDDVVVLTTTPPAHAPVTPDAPGVDVRRWPVLRDSGGNVRGYVQYMSFDIPLLARLIGTRFDVAVAESPPTTGLVAAIIAAIKRRPLVYYAADVWTDGVISMGAPGIVVSVMRWMERAVLRRARSIISVSDEVTERLVLLGAAADRIVTVGNGIDTEIFSPDVEPASNDEYFVYTGTMSEWQQPDIFIRAFAQIAKENPGVRLRFFGQGAVEAQLKQVAEELAPGRVEFGGVVSPAESTSWIRGAAAALVSIVPGIGYDFAKPTKTYAAAATGTPVLFAGPAAGADLVRTGELGLAVDFTPEAVADAMRQLLSEAHDGTTALMRPRRAAWAQQNVSLRAVAERVARAVTQAAAARERKLETSSRRSSSGTERPTQ